MTTNMGQLYLELCQSKFVFTDELLHYTTRNVCITKYAHLYKLSKGKTFYL